MSEATTRHTRAADRVLLSASEAKALAERGLQRIGYSADEARVIAAHVVDCC
jgi:hypothetical protein